MDKEDVFHLVYAVFALAVLASGLLVYIYFFWIVRSFYHELVEDEKFRMIEPAP